MSADVNNPRFTRKADTDADVDVDGTTTSAYYYTHDGSSGGAAAAAATNGAESSGTEAIELGQAAWRQQQGSQPYVAGPAALGAATSAPAVAPPLQSMPMLTAGQIFFSGGDIEIEIDSSNPPDPSVVERGRCRRWASKILVNPCVNVFYVVLLLAQIVLLCFAVNYAVNSTQDREAPWYMVLDTVIVFLFLAEVILRIVALGAAYFKTIFNLVDLVLLVLVVFFWALEMASPSSLSAYQAIVLVFRFSGRLFRVFLLARHWRESRRIQSSAAVEIDLATFETREAEAVAAQERAAHESAAAALAAAAAADAAADEAAASQLGQEELDANGCPLPTYTSALARAVSVNAQRLRQLSSPGDGGSDTEAVSDMLARFHRANNPSFGGGLTHTGSGSGYHSQHQQQQQQRSVGYSVPRTGTPSYLKGLTHTVDGQGHIRSMASLTEEELIEANSATIRADAVQSLQATALIQQQRRRSQLEVIQQEVDTRIQELQAEALMVQQQQLQVQLQQQQQQLQQMMKSYQQQQREEEQQQQQQHPENEAQGLSAAAKVDTSVGDDNDDAHVIEGAHEDASPIADLPTKEEIMLHNRQYQRHNLHNQHPNDGLALVSPSSSSSSSCASVASSSAALIDRHGSSSTPAGSPTSTGIATFESDSSSSSSTSAALSSPAATQVTGSASMSPAGTELTPAANSSPSSMNSASSNSSSSGSSSNVSADGSEISLLPADRARMPSQARGETESKGEGDTDAHVLSSPFSSSSSPASASASASSTSPLASPAPPPSAQSPATSPQLISSSSPQPHVSSETSQAGLKLKGPSSIIVAKPGALSQEPASHARASIYSFPIVETHLSTTGTDGSEMDSLAREALRLEQVNARIQEQMKTLQLQQSALMRSMQSTDHDASSYDSQALVGLGLGILGSGNGRRISISSPGLNGSGNNVPTLVPNLGVPLPLSSAGPVMPLGSPREGHHFLHRSQATDASYSSSDSHSRGSAYALFPVSPGGRRDHRSFSGSATGPGLGASLSSTGTPLHLRPSTGGIDDQSRSPRVRSPSTSQLGLALQLGAGMGVGAGLSLAVLEENRVMPSAYAGRPESTLSIHTSRFHHPLSPTAPPHTLRPQTPRPQTPRSGADPYSRPVSEVLKGSASNTSTTSSLIQDHPVGSLQSTTTVPSSELSSLFEDPASALPAGQTLASITLSSGSNPVSSQSSVVPSSPTSVDFGNTQDEEDAGGVSEDCTAYGDTGLPFAD